MHGFTIGVSHEVLWDLGLVRALNEASRIGYSAFELWAEPPIIDPLSMNVDVIENLRNFIENLNLKLSVHAAHWDMNIASFNPIARRLAIQYAKGAVLIATLLNAKLVVLHPGSSSLRRASRSQVFRLAVNGLSEVIHYALDKGVRIAIENMERDSKSIFSTPSEVSELIEELNSLTGARIGLALNVAHASTVMDPVKYIEQLRDKIIHVYISDVSRNELYLPIGEGTLDVESIIRKLLNLNYSNMIVVEGYVPNRNIQVARNSFARLREVILKVAGELPSI